MLDPSFNLSVFTNPPRHHFGKRIIIGAAVFFLCFSVLFFVLFLSAPANFSANIPFAIAEGSGLSQTARYLKSHNVIRSEFFFKAFTVILASSKSISAGNYIFEKNVSVWNVAWRLGHGEHGFPLVRVTIPEGVTLAEMAKIYSSKLVLFDAKEFATLTKDKEGYLFPDTYLFDSGVSAKQVVAKMEDNFAARTGDITIESLEKKRKFSDVVTMASILEEEASDETSRRIIAGILWKRITLGMPLQVDATLKYITGRGTSELTTDDLKIKSPYNSYTRLGLPPTPISNPGLASLEDALNPTKTSYLYFLSDKKGVMHYAATLDEHNVNKAKYLP